MNYLGRELKARAYRLRETLDGTGAAAAKLAAASSEADAMVGLIADYVNDVKSVGTHRADAVEERQDDPAVHFKRPAEDDGPSRWTNEGALPSELLRPRQKTRFSHNYSENLRRLMGYARGMDRSNDDRSHRTPRSRHRSARRTTDEVRSRHSVV